MNQFAINHQFDDDHICAQLLSTAQRELAAFFRAVTEMFGSEQAELSAEEWLHEVEASRTLPASTREWRGISAKVITRLADRWSEMAAIATGAQLQPANF